MDLRREVKLAYRKFTLHDDIFAQSVSRFGYQMVVELVGVAGFYSMVALTLNAFEALPARGRTTLPRFPRS
jgi:alkylhydroperoxidase family enzyme